MNSTFKLCQRGREERELGKRRQRRGKPCAPAGPGRPRPGRLVTTLRSKDAEREPHLTQKHKSVPSLPSRTDPAASPPSPALKGPADIQLSSAHRGRGVGAPRAGGSTDSGERGGEPGLRGSFSLRGQGRNPSFVVLRTAVFPPPASQPLLQTSCLYREGIKKSETV